MSVLKDPQGTDWPLGHIAIVTPGTPVSIMSLVDPGGVAAPGKATGSGVPEYTRRAQQIMFQGFTPNVATGHGMTNNTGNVYIVRGGAAGARDDPGRIVAVLGPGQTIFLASAPTVNDVWSPYRYYLDGDTAADGAIVTLLIF